MTRRAQVRPLLFIPVLLLALLTFAAPRVTAAPQNALRGQRSRPVPTTPAPGAKAVPSRGGASTPAVVPAAPSTNPTSPTVPSAAPPGAPRLAAGSPIDDDFEYEDAPTSRGWDLRNGGGTIATSSDHAFTGERSMRLEGSMPGIGKSLTSVDPRHARLTIRYYDDGSPSADLQVFLYYRDGSGFHSSGVGVSPGFSDYITAAGPYKSSSYVPRSVGWHTFKFEIHRGTLFGYSDYWQVNSYIDGTSPTGWSGPLDVTELVSLWVYGKGTASYVDDFTLEDNRVTQLTVVAPGVTYGNDVLAHLSVDVVNDGNFLVSVDGGPATVWPAWFYYADARLSGLGAGPHTLAVSYVGAEGALPSSATATVNVARAPLTIEANDQTYIWNHPPFPTFTSTFTTLVNHDTEASLTTPVVYTTAPPGANADSLAGDYVITPSGATSPNYDITFVPGTLHILWPVPVQHAIAPWRGVAGDPDTTITVTGEDLTPSSVVRWCTIRGSVWDLATTFVDTQHLSAVIPASLLTAPGFGLVTVFTPTPGGGTSRVLAFRIEPQGREKIFFTKTTGYQSNIWMMNPDGTQPVAVTTGQYQDFQPRLSPDGTTIAFARATSLTRTNGCSNIWVRHLQSGVETQVTDGGTTWGATWPAWSSDGHVLAFTRHTLAVPGLCAGGPDEDSRRIYKVPYWPTLGEAMVFIHPFLTAGAQSSPSFSPDNRSILFQQRIDSGYPGMWNLVQVGTAEAFETIRSTASAAGTFGDWNPQWRPDGQAVLWESYRLPGYWASIGLSAVPEDTSALTPGVLSPPAPLSAQGWMMPAWSPDGQKIIASDAMHGHRLWILNADGSSAFALPTLQSGTYPTWGVVAFAALADPGNGPGGTPGGGGTTGGQEVIKK